MARKTIWTAQSKAQIVAAMARRGFDRGDVRTMAEHAYATGYAATPMTDMPGHVLVISYANTEVDMWDAEIMTDEAYAVIASRAAAYRATPSAELVEAVGPSAAYAIAAGNLAAMPVIMANCHRAPVGTVPTGNGPADDIRAHRDAMHANGRNPFAPIGRYLPTPTVDALLAAIAGHSDGLSYLWGSAYVPDYAARVAPLMGRRYMVIAHVDMSRAGDNGRYAAVPVAMNALTAYLWERAESLRTPDDCGGEFCDGGDTCGPCYACDRAERWHAAHEGEDTRAARRSLLGLVNAGTPATVGRFGGYSPADD